MPGVTRLNRAGTGPLNDFGYVKRTEIDEDGQRITVESEREEWFTARTPGDDHECSWTEFKQQHGVRFQEIIVDAFLELEESIEFKLEFLENFRGKNFERFARIEDY